MLFLGWQGIASFIGVVVAIVFLIYEFAKHLK